LKNYKVLLPGEVEEMLRESEDKEQKKLAARNKQPTGEGGI